MNNENPNQIEVSGSILTWAREGTGLKVEEVGKKITTIDTSVLKHWEANGGDLLMGQIRALADLYRRPSAIFFLNTAPNAKHIPDDFRTLPLKQNVSSLTTEFSKNTLLAVRRALRTQNLIAELSEEPTEFITMRKASLLDNPTELASKLRNLLEVEINNQAKWKDKFSAYSNWVQAFENIGVIIVEHKMNIEEARGFVLTGNNKKPPIITVNRSDDVHGRIFSIFHEYAHLLLKEDGVTKTDGYEVYFSDTTDQIEKFCNEFAGSFLVPDHWLFSQPETQNINSATDWNETLLKTWSRELCVSREVILRRLLKHKFTTQEFYKRITQKWHDEAMKAHKKPIPMGKKYRPKQLLKENSRTLTKLVINALNTENISTGEAARYLRISNLSYLGELEKYLYK